jgi:hypothetical protein
MREPIPEAIEKIAKEIVDSAFRVHTTLGPVCWNRFTKFACAMN